MNDPYFVGIDVSKDGFDVEHTPRPQYVSCFLYTAAGIGKLIARLSARNVALACMEATGGYEQKLALALADAGFTGWRWSTPAVCGASPTPAAILAKTDRDRRPGHRPLTPQVMNPTALAKARSRSGRDQRAGRAPPAAGGVIAPARKTAWAKP